MAGKCSNVSANMKHCNCTYSACDKRGNCCACIQYHLSMKQLPACAFPKDAERTYDRSFRNFVKVCKEHYGIEA